MVSYAENLAERQLSESLSGTTRLRPFAPNHGNDCSSAIAGVSGPTGNVSAQPRHIWFIDEFPMTVTGKLQKYRVRERAQEKMFACMRLWSGSGRFDLQFQRDVFPEVLQRDHAYQLPVLDDHETGIATGLGHARNESAGGRVGRDAVGVGRRRDEFTEGRVGPAIAWYGLNVAGPDTT